MNVATRLHEKLVHRGRVAVGNRLSGVAQPYLNPSEEQRNAIFADSGLTIGVWRDRLKLYPWLANWLFGRMLHFCARLQHV